MKTNNVISSCLLAAGMIIFSPSIEAQSTPRTSLRLPGCPVTDVSSNTSGNFLVAACESPIGLQHSFGFGTSWTFSTGGGYASGSAKQVEVLSNAVYALVGSSIYKSALPPSGATTWSPTWTAVSALSAVAVQSFSRFGDYLILIANNQIHAFSTTSDTLVQSISIPTGTTVTKAEVGNSSYLFASVNTGTPASAYIVRTSFDASNATTPFGTSWTDLSSSTGAPTGLNLWNFIPHPSSPYLYVGWRDASGAQFVDTLYVSTDNGDTFSTTTQSFVPNSGCFSGTNFIVGTALSTDSGTSWTNLVRPGTSSGLGRYEDGVCLFNPTTSEQALIKTNQGFDLLDTISGGSPNSSSASTDLAGTIVKRVSSAISSPSRLALGTSSGVAYTDNFTTTPINWIYPICPGGDCVGGKNIIFDPADANVLYYGSGSIPKGEITGSGATAQISWSDWAQKPEDAFNISTFRSYALLPGKIVVGYWRIEGAIGGGLYIYDTSNPSTPATSSDLAGKPVRGFIPISSTRMIASVFGSNSTDDGLYLSVDGGSSWSKVVSLSVSNTNNSQQLSEFAYYMTGDILYGWSGSSSNNTINVLTNASSSSDWQSVIPTQNGQPITLSTLAVDPTSGILYGSRNNTVLRSLDQGSTWSEIVSGYEGETTNDLKVTESTSAEVQSLNSSSRLVQGSNAGVFEISSESLATPTPTPTVVPTEAPAAPTSLRVVRLRRFQNRVKIRWNTVEGITSYQLRITRSVRGQERITIRTFSSRGRDKVAKRIRLRGKGEYLFAIASVSGDTVGEYLESDRPIRVKRRKRDRTRRSRR